MLYQEWKANHSAGKYSDLKDNPFFKFTRGRNAQENLKQYLSTREEPLDWKDFEKMSFSDKIQSVEGVIDNIVEHLGAFVKFDYNKGLIRYKELSH